MKEHKKRNGKRPNVHSRYTALKPSTKKNEDVKTKMGRL